MRASCNGCRILRKACAEDCCIRPCLQWMKCPESQANATLFLAKFYGRAGLINLVNAAAERHRPDVFRSLLYEACGRVVNPTYGSVGLLWSGNWQLCQRAVEAVLKGSPIVQMTSETAAGVPLQSLRAFGLRHVFKNDTDVVDLHKVARASHAQFKHASAAATATNPRWGQFYVSPGRVSEENESMLTAEGSMQSTEEDEFSDGEAGIVDVKLDLSLCL